MSREQLNAFLAKGKLDKSIEDKFKAAKNPEEILEIAKEHGHHFAEDMLKSRQLTDDELEGIEGGNCVTASWFKV